MEEAYVIQASFSSSDAHYRAETSANTAFDIVILACVQSFL